MLILLFRFAMFLLLAMSSVAWAADQVLVLETRTLPRAQLPAPGNATHDLRLALYTFRRARWRTEDIVAAVLDALPMLAQCGIAMANVELLVLEAPLKS